MVARASTLHRPRMLRLVVVIAVAACAPAYRPLRLEPPSERLATRGAELAVRTWRPAGASKGVIVIHHGLADHGARYAELAARLTAAGYTVWAFDMRGHAHASGRRVVIDDIDDLVDDLDAVVRRAREPGKPLFLFGHSLGGLVTTVYEIERRPDVAGVVLSAPGLAFDVPAFGIGAIRFIAAIAPNAPILDTPHDDFSTSAAVIADMKRDPMIETPKGPARTSRAATEGLRRVWAHPERFVAPLLAVHGTADKIVAPIASRDLVARAGTEDRTLRLYDGFQHDLLHEPEGARVATEIIAWLDAHVAGQPSPLASAPPRTLKGDRASRALGVELDARGEHSDDGGTGGSGGLRLRLELGRVGYVGGFDVRVGYVGGVYLLGDLHALGFGVRAAGGASIAITGGIGVRRAQDTSLTVPLEAALELPLGPLHVMARGGVNARALGDELRALLGIRVGRDHRYWPGTAAGAGPFVAVTYQNIQDTDVLGIAIGGQLWGAN